jgi:hypothetical protein
MILAIVSRFVNKFAAAARFLLKRRKDNFSCNKAQIRFLAANLWLMKVISEYNCGDRIRKAIFPPVEAEM